MQRKSYKIFFLVFLYIGTGNNLFQSNLFAQAGCGPAVPTFTVDLTGQPNGSWISPDTIRDDNCCGTSNPDRCIQFVITLDTAAQGILFDLYSGAVPPGAMYYQINCGPQVPVGNAICLTGVGPHYLTFCKPGNNNNTYIITSIGSASAQGDSVTTNCNSGMLIAYNFYEPSIIWTSVFPAPNGAYNSYLSCTSACDTVFANPPPGAPPYIDYQICGNISTLCDTIIVCDTVRVYVYAPVQLSAPGNVCAGAATASVTATPSGGAAPYTYLWNPAGQTTQTATGLSAGTYTVTLTDAIGCTSSAVVNIYSVGNPTTTVTPADVSCFGGNNGSILSSSSGGTSPYSFSWNTGQTTSAISGLPTGNYSVIVTDANGCADTAYASIAEPTALTYTLSQTDVLCNGASTGLASVSTSGGTPAYTYSWSNGQTTSAATNISAGNYSVTLSDANGCTATASFSITQPTAITTTVSSTNVSCSGGNNGTAIISSSGGVTSHSYLWSNGQTTASVSGLTSGNYTITVTDGNGCTKTNTVAITQPNVLSSTNSQNNVSCFGGNNGNANTSVSGGTPNYTYLWSNGQTTSTATNLSAGNYSVTITDANGCTSTNTVSITQPAAPLSYTSSQNNVLCFGGSNGSANVFVSGGTPSYSYLWSNGQTTSYISNLIAGNYSVTITDSNGCTATNTFTITQPVSPLSFSASQNNVSCNGGNNGSANVSVSGGTPAYTYLWNNGQTTSSISNLIAGNYSVMITDGNGCVATSSFVITQPTTLANSASQNNISCFGANNGSASVNISGGTPAYTYLWNTGQTTSSIAGLPSGNYSVSINDANGCTITSSFIITEPTLLMNSSSQNNVSCFGGSNGSANVSVSGGTPSYSYLWSNGQTTSSVANLIAGNYSVTITDGNGCTTIASFVITQPIALLNSSSQNNVSCFGGNNGTAAVNVSGGTPAYTYLWNTGQTTSSISNLLAGTYSVMITDANGCSITAVFSITQPTALSTTTSSTNEICGQANGTASANASGGTGTYTYQWNNGQTTSTASGLITGNYSLTITDANGCTVTASIIVSGTPGVIASVQSASNVSCFLGSNGSASVTATNGVPSFTYLWNTGQTTTAISNVPAGTYTCTVTDANNCSDTAVITITQPQILSLSPSQNNISCFGGNNGNANVSVSGGTPNYTYSWSNGQTTSSATNLSAGNYSVTVTDANGCMDTTSFLIVQPAVLTSSLSQSNVSCFAGSNGSAMATPSGGTSPYTYLWNNSQTTSSATGLIAGNYSVTITDANGCTTTSTATITQPTLLSMFVSPDDTICSGQTTQISAFASGGTQPYTYFWSQPMWTGSGPYNVTQTVTSSYTVSITDINGCQTLIDTITIYVYPIPIVNAPDVSVCQGQSATITANSSGGTGGPYSYSWSNSFNGQTQVVTVPISQSPANYIVTANDGCINVTDTVTVTVNPIATGSISVSSATGCAPLSATFSAFSDTIATYFWNFGDGYTGTDSVVTHTYATGTYLVSVTIITAAGCSTLVSGTTVVNAYPTPTAGCGTGTSVTPMTQNNISFVNNSSGAISYLWDFGDGINSTEENPQHYYSSIGTYMITMIATNQYGCSDTCTIETYGYGLSFPNAFTPNSSSSNGGSYNPYNLDNDVFFPFASGVEKFKMMIFNRWGELIFETNDLTIGWDGYYRGKLCQQDVYVWKATATFIDGTHFSKAGDVTLLR